MKVTIQRYLGDWFEETAEVLRVTKTMIVIRWGHGERRFNRKTGRETGAAKRGLSATARPFIRRKNLLILEEEIERGEK